MILRKRNAWLFAFAFFLGFLALGWQHKMRREFAEGGLKGDGRNVSTYGFVIDSLAAIAPEDVVPSGVPRDGLQALAFPDYLDARGLDSLNAEGRKPFLFDHDRVIGVSVGGESRAYPVSILNWHEVLLDTLAGRPVLVTWNPLCGAACAYDRELTDGSAHFGVSGLLYNSNTLLYDREGESLWSQLTGRALTGPAAGRNEQLRRIPARLTRWGAWRERHPNSLVLAPDPVWLHKKYRRRPYVSYEGSDRLQFPVRGLEEAKLMRHKTPVLSVWAGGERRLYPFPLIAERSGASGAWRTTQGGAELSFRHWPGTPAVAEVTGEGILAVQAYWFAWHSQIEDAEALLATP